MPDIMSISAAISSVRAATDIAKLIKDSNVSLADAEIKLKIADLISALADAKIDLAEIQDVLRDKDILISDLKTQLSVKDMLKFDGKLYRKEGDEVPFCPVCLERDSKQHHLTYVERQKSSGAYYYCKICEKTF